MAAEQLIALEAALAELGTLYTVGRGFTALHARAESELLPRTTALARSLRSLLRAGHLTDHAISDTASEIFALRAQWQRGLEELRGSAEYQQALKALAADEQPTLARLVPRIFAGFALATPIPDLFFGVSASSGRRRPGSSPFLSAPQCANTIVQTLADGLVPDDTGTQWWERELACISCAPTPAALDTPISLLLAVADVRVAVFRVADEASFRIFTPRLRGPFSIVLATEAVDEWWDAYEDSYRAFRDALHQELTARGHTVSLIDLANE